MNCDVLILVKNMWDRTTGENSQDTAVYKVIKIIFIFTWNIKGAVWTNFSWKLNWAEIVNILWRNNSFWHYGFQVQCCRDIYWS